MRGWEISEQAEWEACMRAAEREAALHQRAAKRMREQEAAKERHTFLRRRAARVETERVTEIAAEAAAACMGGTLSGAMGVGACCASAHRLTAGASQSAEPMLYDNKLARVPRSHACRMVSVGLCA